MKKYLKKVICPKCKQERLVDYRQLWNIKKGYNSGRCPKCAKRKGYWKKGCIPWNKGLKEYRKGYIHSQETRWKISEGQRGRKHFKKSKKKMSLARKGIYIKEKCPAWKGGISREPYPFDFNEELKNLIRKRDDYKCRICNCPQEECFDKLIVHHIDYDKKNINPNNLITLCRFCHPKTNYNRINWKKYLSEKISH